MNAQKVMAVLALVSVVGCNTTTADKSSSPTATSPPVAAGPIDIATGMPKSAIAVVIESDFVNQVQINMITYYRGKVSNSQLAAAPTNFCNSKNLELHSSEVKPLDPPTTQNSDFMTLTILCK